MNPTKIKGGCQLGRKVVPHDSKSDLPLVGSCLVPDAQTKFVCAAQKILSSSAFSDLYRDGCCGAEGGRTGLMQKQILLSSVLKLLDSSPANICVTSRSYFQGKTVFNFYFCTLYI